MIAPDRRADEDPGAKQQARPEGGQGELAAIRERYARRATLPADRYAATQPDVRARVAERQRATTELLAAQGLHSLHGMDVIEVGCGGGSNLVELIARGVEPARLAGIDLLEERIDLARQRLPPGVRLTCGDASALQAGDPSFDIVCQFTVFSSILDPALRHHLAAAMWRWTKPGGAVLWYDFTVDNPRNPDVRGVPLACVRELFPQGRITHRRVTLAPPIARAVCRVHPAFYGVFNALPLLRTHVLAWIAKPG